MGCNPTKSAENMYCQCRKQAAKFNERLNSREGAAEMLNVHPSTISDYELGVTKMIPVEMVVKMADLYGAPELKNYYCTHDCPIGRDSFPQLQVEELDRLAIKIFSAFRQAFEVKEELLDIAADGIIDDEERPRLQHIITDLEAISTYAQELKLWAEKNLK